MYKIVEGGPELKRRLGDNGRHRVVENFSYEIFAEKLHNIVRKQES